MSNWIKCSDREHPDLIMDESGECAASKPHLVSIWERSTMAVAYFCECYDKDGPWKRTWVDALSDMDFDLRCRVTHWQPLPDAPNE